MTMENKELIVLEEKNELAALSTDEGIKGIVEKARESIYSLSGGNLETKTGRKNIRSNAFKATKLKTRLFTRADDLIKSVEEKIKPELLIIQSIKDNKKILGANLDELRKDVNTEVDQHEAEIQRIEDERLKEEEAKKLVAEFEHDYEIGYLMNEKFDRELLEAKKESEAEAARIAEQEAKDLLIHEQKLKDEAAAAAKLKAENDAKEAIRLAEKAKQDAIDRENQVRIDAEVARQRSIDLAVKLKQDTINAEKKAKQEAINAANLAIENEAYSDDYAFDAERKRLYDIEQTRLTEIQRQKDVQAKIDDETLAREQDKNHRRKINRAIIKALVDGGISEDDAKKVIIMAVAKLLPNLVINY